MLPLTSSSRDMDHAAPLPTDEAVASRNLGLLGDSPFLDVVEDGESMEGSLLSVFDEQPVFFDYPSGTNLTRNFSAGKPASRLPSQTKLSFRPGVDGKGVSQPPAVLSPGRVTVSRKHSAETWEARREEIAGLYLNQELPLQSKYKLSVMEVMEGRQFFATRKQYTDHFTKWGLDQKNVKKQEMNAILNGVRKRKLEQDDDDELSEVVGLNGRVVPAHKIKRAIRRKRVALEEEHDDSRGDPSLVRRLTPDSEPKIQYRQHSPFDSTGMTFLHFVQYSNDSSPLLGLCRSSETRHSPIKHQYFHLAKLDLNRNWTKVIDFKAFKLGLDEIWSEPVAIDRCDQAKELQLKATLQATMWDQSFIPSEKICETLHDLGMTLQRQSRYHSSQTVLLRAALIRGALSGSSHRLYLRTFILLAKVLGDLRNEEVVQICKYVWAQQLQEDVYKSNVADTLDTMYSLARGMQHRGWYQDAKILLENLIDYLPNIGEDKRAHERILKSQSELAYVREKMKSLDKDNLILQRCVLQSCKDTYGEKDQVSIEQMKYTADMELIFGNHDKAASLFLESLELAQKTFGRRYILHAEIFCGLSTMNFVLKQYSTAVEYGKQAVDLFTSLRGPNSRLTLEAVGVVVKSYQALKEYPDAEILAEPWARAYQTSLGKEHQRTLRSMKRLADIRYANQDFRGAIQIDLEVLEATRSSHGDDYHPAVICCHKRLKSSYEGLSEAYYDLGLLYNAVLVDTRILELTEAFCADDEIELAWARTRLKSSRRKLSLRMLRENGPISRLDDSPC